LLHSSDRPTAYPSVLPYSPTKEGKEREREQTQMS